MKIRNVFNEEFIGSIKEMCENFGKDHDVPIPKIEIIRLQYPTFKWKRMISEETFNQIIENGPNDVFIDNAGIIWEFCEIRRNRPVYKKVWVIEGEKYPYTEDYQSLIREIEEKR